MVTNDLQLLRAFSDKYFKWHPKTHRYYAAHHGLSEERWALGS